MNSTIETRRFDAPDQHLDMKQAGAIRGVQMKGGATGMHAVFEPGWTSEKEEKPLLGNPDSCPMHHTGYNLSGDLVVPTVSRADQASWLVVIASLTCLSACGGGSGTQAVALTPPPVSPPPPPPAAAAVTIFANPSPAQYSSVGASIAGPGGNLDTYAAKDERFGAISTNALEQAHVRYNSAGYYEVQLPGSAWDRLVHYGGLLNPTTENNYFQPSTVATNYGYLAVSNAVKWKGYTYSEMGSWGSKAAGRWGHVAFGTATQASGVPVTGSATFEGRVQGNADVMQANNLYGGFAPLALDGSVSLNFNFAAGTLSGEMQLFGPDGMNPFKVGTFAFKETVFAAGSTSYSGKFDTSASGENFFMGRFTGPAAQETIGAWALPFVFSSGGESTPADNQVHQAFGAWIARRP